MRISLIVAMDRNGLIGAESGLPWYLSADLKRFRKLTTGKPIILGRRTLDHIGGPLKNRLNIVLTRQINVAHPGCEIAHSIEEALARAQRGLIEMAVDEMMIIGGAEVYRQALPLVERVYLTLVDGEFSGNTWFPTELTFRGRIVHDETFPADAKNAHAHRLVILDRDDAGLTIEQVRG